MSFFEKMLTSGSGISSKRFNTLAALAFFFMVTAWVIDKKTPVANVELANKCIDILEIIILSLVVGVTFEPAIKRLGLKNLLEGQAEVKKAEKGVSDVNIDNVNEQTINK